MTLYYCTSFDQNACVEFVPAAFRKPDLHLCESVSHRLCHRGDEHIVTEHILAAEFHVVCFLSFRPFVIKRTAQGDTFVISLTGHRIDVWRHIIALTYCLTDDVGIFFCEYPRFLVEGTALRTVGTHYRAESAVLKPSCVHFRIDVVSEVSSDVVAPISVKYI